MEGPTRIGERVFVVTAGGYLTGTVHGYGSSLGEYDRRGGVVVVRMDWSGLERICLQPYVRLLQAPDPTWTIIDGRIYQTSESTS